MLFLIPISHLVPLLEFNLFEIHEVTPDGRRQVKETFHDAGQATRALERLRTKEQLEAKEQQP